MLCPIYHGVGYVDVGQLGSPVLRCGCWPSTANGRSSAILFLEITLSIKEAKQLERGSRDPPLATGSRAQGSCSLTHARRCWLNLSLRWPLPLPPFRTELVLVWILSAEPELECPIHTQPVTPSSHI